MKKRAFITGIGGQDGSYLSEYLLELGYEVYGIIRRNSIPEHQESRLSHLNNKIITYYGDVLDQSSISSLLKEIQPDEIYNLAAQSHVRISFDVPELTIKTNANGAFNVLEAYRRNCPHAKYYQASSSEMFGNQVSRDNMQQIDTQMIPVSPYGASKLFAFNMTKLYRESYNLHAVNGILFNHESPRRASNFVTTKIIKTACEILYGFKYELVLGNLDSQRDWGHSYDYVRAMHLILNQDSPIDTIVATGETRSVRDLCKIVFDQLGLDYTKYVIQDERYMRPNELRFLKGDNYEILKLGWKRKYTFESMIKEMVEFYIQKVSAI